MATSQRDPLAGASGIDDPGEPFAFAVEGDTIVGRWDILRATSLHPTEVTHLGKSSRIGISLDARRHEFDLVELHGSTPADPGPSVEPVTDTFNTGRGEAPLLGYLEGPGWTL